MSVKEFVQQCVNQRRSVRSQPFLQDDHIVWNLLDEEHYSMLYQLLQSPFTFSPTNSSPNCFRIATSDDTVNDDQVATFYLLVSTFIKKQFISAVDQYKQLFPADALWADNIQNAAVQSESQKISIFYAGTTVRTAYQRLVEDYNDTSVKLSRNKNWNCTIYTHWRVYTIENLRLDLIGSDFTVIDTFKLLGYLEDILIKCIADASINSANGDKYCDWTPSKDEMQSVVRAFHLSLPAPDFSQTTKFNVNIVDQTKIMEHFLNYNSYMKKTKVKDIDNVHPSLVQNMTRDAMVENQWPNLFVHGELPKSAMKTVIYQL